MSFKYPKNVIVGVSVVAALLAATVLLGGYANSKPASTKAQAKAGCCPIMAASAGYSQMMAAQAESTGCPRTPYTEGCPKPCGAGENAEGCCDNPCPIPCPKPCCMEEGCCGLTGCQIAAAETNAR
ncbi:MAG: hypothetical protein JW837_00350 [Sedimentisphaerales bacterium]|nr:hypothetical protein [Sedimentisphaerales bacterium]